MPNPYAPRVKRAEAPAFPSGRFARLGANPLQIAVGEWAWDQMSEDDQVLAAGYLAGMADEELGLDLTDDELAEPGELTLEAVVAVHDWAMAEVDAGTYTDREEALEALDDAVADLVLPGCLICADMTDDPVAELPEHVPAAHVGDTMAGHIFASPVPFIKDLPTTEAPVFSAEWFAEALPDGPAIIATYGDPAAQAAEADAKWAEAERMEAEQLAELEAFLVTQDDPAAAADALRQLAEAEHEGEPQPRDGNGELIPTPEALAGVVTPEGGPVDPANIPVGESGPEQFVPGGPGTADGGAVAAPPAAPSPSGADQVLAEEAGLRIGGTIAALMEWVGDDVAKASAVRTAEQAKPTDDQRVTLFAELDKVTGPGAG